MKYILSIVTLLIFTTSLLSGTTKSVFILHSYSNEYPWTKGQSQGFIQNLKKSQFNINVHTEYLDTKRLAFTEQYKSSFTHYLKEKYTDFEPDVIYVTDDNALTFMREYKNIIFPSSHVVFSGINNISVVDEINRNIFTGVFEKKTPSHNIDIIKQFSPDTRDIYFLGDNSNTYKIIEQELFKVKQDYSGYKFHFLAHEKMTDMIQNLQELKPSIILLTTIGKFLDDTGSTIHLSKTLKQLTSLQKHTFITMEDAYMDKDIIGGYVTSSQDQGKAAANMVLDFFQGVPFSKIIPQLESPNRYYFDRQVLKSKNITLPKEIDKRAIIINEDISFWTKYSWVINIVFVFLIFTIFTLLVFLVYLYWTKNRIIERQSDILKKAKNKAEALAQQQKNLLSLFDKGDSVLFKWKNTATWDVEYVSANIFNLLKSTKEDFKSGHIAYASCIHPDDIGTVEEEVITALEKNSDFFKHTPYRVLTKDGETKWILDYTVTQKDNQGNITHFIGYLIDVTESKILEHALIKAKETADAANIAKSEFLANMSHEIRTPLNGIIGLTDFVLKTDLNMQQKEKLQIVQSSSKTLLYIINDILDYSKMEAGHLHLDSKPFSLTTVMSNIQSLFELQIKSKDIAFNLTYPKSLNLIGDDLRLLQILINLVGNASKFTQKGSISVDATVDKENDTNVGIIFSITDTGIGIKPEIQEKLFEKFIQADNSTTREYGGTGLGLTISKQLVNLMGGEITLASEKDKGSQFSFTLTFEKNNNLIEEQQINSGIASADQLKDLAYKKILLVEDNKVNQLVLLGKLEDYDIDIDIANNGEEAVSQESKNNYDLILMDLQMPVMDGFEATEIIRKENKSIPIIALSAAVMEEDKEHAIQAGMNEHIAKPIDDNELFTTLLKFLT